MPIGVCLAQTGLQPRQQKRADAALLVTAKVYRRNKSSEYS